MRNWGVGTKIDITLKALVGLTSNLHSTLLRVSAMLRCTGIGISFMVKSWHDTKTSWHHWSGEYCVSMGITVILSLISKQTT